VIRNDPDVRRIVSHFFEHDLPVGHMCHGVQVLAAYGLVRGRRVSAFRRSDRTSRPPAASSSTARTWSTEHGLATGWTDLAEWSRPFMELLDRGGAGLEKSRSSMAADEFVRRRRPPGAADRRQVVPAAAATVRDPRLHLAAVIVSLQILGRRRSTSSCRSPRS